MKYVFKFSTWLLIMPLFFTACECSKNKSEIVSNELKRVNSIYHWKTTFDLDSFDISFLEKHQIRRLYLRMFDVATEHNLQNDRIEIVPIATTKFISTVPKDIEIIPVTYITIDALRSLEGKEIEFASLIVERLLAMSAYNECGDIREIQLDCDWTSSTKNNYIKLCTSVLDILKTKDIALSITVRAHQLQETPPPADRGVLMLYNTGNLKNPETKNSILDINDVKPYLKQNKYPLPLGYAYPTFGWGVKFRYNNFVSIVSSDTISINDNEYIRTERPSVTDIIGVKELVEKQLGQPQSGNILYHLDFSQLKNYTDNEINEILSY